MTSRFRIVQRNALVYRRAWRGSVFFSFLQPAMFLLSMGIGVGKAVDAHTAGSGVSFLHFIAPGLLAAACMQTATFESTYPILSRMTWQHNYEAVMATPMTVLDLVVGELCWVAARLAMVSIAFMGVLVAFGIPTSPLAVLAVPAAILTGLAFSAPIVAYAATLKTSATFNVLTRLLITPLFMFSGVLFPVATMPATLRAIVPWTPLFHGVELVRGLTLGTIGVRASIGHALVLAAMTGIGAGAALFTFRRKLQL